MTSNQAGARHRFAESYLTLESADSMLADRLSAVENITSRYVLDLGNWYDVVPIGRSALPSTILELQRRMSTVLDHARVTLSSMVGGEIDYLKFLLWTTPLPDGPRRGGHLRDFAIPGEPNLPTSMRYEPMPLYLPTVPIDIDIARQGELAKNCYLICAINAVAHGDSSALTAMVAADPEDATHVIVRVSGGTYRLPATLPVDDWTGDEVYSTSPDGSTLVAYVEKAAAAHFGSWSDLARGDPGFALRWLVGKRFARTDSQLVSAMSDPDLDRAFTLGSFTVVAIPGQAQGSPGSACLERLGARGGHGYTLRRYDDRGLAWLHDPYLDRHPRPMSFDDLRMLGARVAWCSDPQHAT